MPLLPGAKVRRFSWTRSKRRLAVLALLAIAAAAGCVSPRPVLAACPETIVQCLAGRIDNFGTGDGPELSSPSAALVAGMRAGCEGIMFQFDSLGVDQCIGHTFTGCWSAGCAAGATLTMHVKGGPGSTDTDDLLLGDDGTTPVYVISFNALQNLYTGGADNSWDPDDEATFVLELGNLPAGSLGGPSILSTLQDGDLDIIVNDDTMVDYFKLDVQEGSTPTIPGTWGALKSHYR